MIPPSPSDDLRFTGGRNIALKLPPRLFDATLAFYRDTLRLPVLEEFRPHQVIEFGQNHLWLDPVEGLAAAEIWLEVIASDLAAAKLHLAEAGVDRCDEIETLPPGFEGFWIRSPSATVHLVCGSD